VTYTYDNNGNTLTKTVGSDTTTYTWDYENRLASVTLPSSGGTVYFKYDPLGRRIYKSLSSSTSVYAYDGDNLIEETNSSGTAVARYAQGLNIDEPLAMLRSSATSYYNADGLGSITSLANGSGTLTQTYTYDSFGKVTASSGSLVNPFQYTGREADAETGLYYYRARYYGQTEGRFLGEDPSRFGYPANLYVYAENSPTYFIDPTGLEPEGCKDCADKPRQGVVWGQYCCGNEPPKAPDSSSPYPANYTYRKVNANYMYQNGGNNPWGNIVRACLQCMYAHGVPADIAHDYCYPNASYRVSALDTAFGYTVAYSAGYSFHVPPDPDGPGRHDPMR